MLLLTINTTAKHDELIENLYNVKDILKSKGIYIKINENKEENLNCIKIFSKYDNVSKNVIETMKLYISEEIYKVMMKKFYNIELENIIRSTYFFLKNDELKDIMDILHELLIYDNSEFDKDMIYCINRKNIIKKEINEFLNDNNVINIEGFIRFRMKTLEKNIYEIIDMVVEKYIANKEYNEFIKLLKYFVEIQDSKIDLVNIIFNEDGSCSILDNSKKDLVKEFSNTIEYSENASIDDIIMSGLVTTSPKKIVIHKSKNALNKEFLNTLKSVFEDRVTLCDDCSLCRTDKNIIKT